MEKTLFAFLVALGLTVTAAAYAQDCEEGQTWDETSESCVPESNYVEPRCSSPTGAFCLLLLGRAQNAGRGVGLLPS
jgi:hypothetical protein